MPIYEYQCQVCGNKCEIMHRMSEGPSRDCSECGSANLKKLISAVGFKLKGTGWYETDFKTKKKSVVGEGNPAESKTTKAPENTGKSDKSEKSSAKKAD